jgi:general secretion pathway protein I
MSRRGSAGFTLLEILVAFVVFAIAFGVVLELLSGSLNQTRRAREHTQAALWAKSLMDGVGVEQKLEEGSDSGEFNKTYSWELSIREFEMPDAPQTPAGLYQPLQLFKVELTVRWGQREAKFSTLKMAQRELSSSASG